LAASDTQLGRVYLVGAGPGDPGLLTARALELIACADVILHDRLIPSSALDGARADAELLYVGKEGGGPSVPQERTEEELVAHARAGKTVVRLKGGDPFVFGRGGEEALTLRAASIPFEVVPGVTAGVGASAYAGIPVTHRGLSGAVALVTGHAREDGEGAAASGSDGGVDWQALAAFPGTLVLYMGVRRLPEIATALMAAGRPASEPVALVEKGTLPDQRTVTGTLATIAEIAQREQVKAPSITVVGAVVALAEELAWLGPRPLAGRTVAVTRARTQSSGLARRLEGLGARVIQAPVIRVQTLPGPMPDLAGFDLICLTSPNGVGAFFERLGETGLDSRALAGATVAAIGPGTARALTEHGISADVLPERFVAESLVEALAGVAVTRALVAGPKEAREVLPQALRERGAEVEVLALYETVAEPLSAGAVEQARRADYITFTSSSTVRFFLESVESAQAGGEELGLSPETRIVSIGPVTTETLIEQGLEPHIEAERHDIEGMLAALLADVAL
jgi:uroporphyrinogen III methyltransferase/synthase